MSVVNSIVRAVLFGIAADVLIKGSIISTRYFRRNEGSTDYATIPAVTLSGDFVFSVDILRSGTNTGGQFIFTARNSASGSYGLNLYSSGDWANGTGTISVFGFSGFPAISSLSTDKLYSIKVAYTASTGVLEMYSNNVLEFTGISSPNDGLATADTMAIFGAPQGGFRLYGIVANLKIYDNGTLVRDYPLNDNSNILANQAAVLGEEIPHGVLIDTFMNSGETALSNSVGTLTTDWIDVSSGVDFFVSPIGGTTSRSRWQYTTDGGATVFYGADTLGGSVGDGPALGIISPPDTATHIRVYFKVSADTATDLSIRRADGYGTIINGNADDWGLFDKQADGDWLGQELVVNGGFDSDSGWSTSPNWSISGGVAFADGVGFGLVYQILIRPEIYRLSGSLASGTSGDAEFYDGTAYSFKVGDVGWFSVDIENQDPSYSYIACRAMAGAAPILDNVSVKEVLKNA